jgi:putative flavoprotein involved in K+ transport
MYRTDTIVIGAGQAGLAISRCLTDAGHDHVVLERGRLAERWRSERWDSLRLLTPNWMTRLPGWSYRGARPDGFMTAPELVGYFETYARSFDAPVHEETSVTSVRPVDAGYVVETDQGPWRARNVVIATGVEGFPRVPSMAEDLDPRVHQVTTPRYRNPEGLPDGGVLVVGASATGVQLADELSAAGREVTIAVGAHTRVPRRYRGRDIFAWLGATGLFDTTVDELSDRRAGSRAPSLQLIGRSSHESIDLATLQRRGVQLVGRLRGTNGTAITLADDLAATVDAADTRLHRILDLIDDHIAASGCARLVPGEPSRPDRVLVPSAPTSVDLRDRGISTVVWATGFGRSYPWLHVPVTDDEGEIVQHRGVTAADGLYVLGLRFQHHRNSNFIDGVGRDAAFVARHIVGRARHEGHRLEDVAA